MSKEQLPIPQVKPGEKNILITSALPYVNNVPHLGNIIGCVLSADVYARYCRARGYNTMFVCGTDEYGTTTEQRAIEEHLTPEQICAKYHEIHRQVYEWFDISFNKFGRTSTPKQTEITHEIFHQLDAAGNITQEDVEQHYCVKCERFLADRFVEGICPLCGAEGARGDQCDECQKIYNAKDLKNPRCKLCGSTPEFRISRHLFIDLPKLQGKLSAYVDEAADTGRWTQNSVQVARAWCKDLRTRCITRDLKWGTPVPKEGFENKVFYVWFDAPIGYISITANLTENWRDWWIPSDPQKGNVRLVQFMGKDNLPFHTIIFPGTLLGTEKPWTLMHSISTTEYLNYEGAKFSKSRGTGVFGDNAMESGIASEVFRYYLLVNRPESADAMFTWADFGDKNNNELLKNIGNFCHRGLTFIASNFASTIPEKVPEERWTDLEKSTITEINRVLEKYFDAMERIWIKDGLKHVMEISSLGNKYMQDAAPWNSLKSGDKKRAGDVMCFIANIISLLASIAEPFIPGFTRKVRAQMNLPNPIEPALMPMNFSLDLVPEGHVIGTPEPIFRRMDKKELDAFKEKYSGQQKSDDVASSNSAKKGKSGKKGNSEVKREEIIVPEGAKVLNADFRIGKIVSVDNHPSADKLYLLKVDVGEDAPRQVVSGIKDKYTPEDLLNRLIVLVCNLKPSKLRGVVSEGMVLTGDNGETYELCAPEAEAAAAAAEGQLVGARLGGEGVCFVPPAKKFLDSKLFAKIPLRIEKGKLCLEDVTLSALDKDGVKPLCNIVTPGIVDGGVK